MTTKLCNFCSKEIPENAKICPYCNKALAAGKHREIYTLSSELGIDEKIVYSDVVRFYKATHSAEIANINNAIRGLM